MHAKTTNDSSCVSPLNLLNLKDDDQADDEGSPPALEAGPKFHTNQRVLCVDSNQVISTDAANTQSNQPRPLYEAVVKRSGLRHVDPTTNKILPETKLSFSKKRGRCHGGPNQQILLQQLNNPHTEKQWCHLIHFQGWNSRWDQWMTEGEIFPDVEEHRVRLATVTAVGGGGGGGTGVVRSEESAEKDNPKKKKKLGRPKKMVNEDDSDGGMEVDDTVDLEMNRNLQKISNACTLPFTLQTILVDDRDKITKKVYPPPSFTSAEDESAEQRWRKGITMLHALPSQMSIMKVLAEFVQAKKREDLEEFAREQERLKEIQQPHQLELEGGVSAEENNTKQQTEEVQHTKHSSAITTKAILKLKKKKRKEFALSILSLVDASLPLFLLYNQERGQYLEVMMPDSKGEGEEGRSAKKRPCEVYGAEHLLRLFVRLPLLLSKYDLSAFTTSKVKTAADGVIDKENGNVEKDVQSTTLSSEEITQEIAGFISELIVFMQRNRDLCFEEKYCTSTAKLLRALH